MRKDRNKLRGYIVLGYLFLIAGAITMLLPFVWMIVTSLKSYGEATRVPLTILPENWKPENYQVALDTLPFVRLYFNTFLMMAARVVLAIVFSSMAGYAFARMKFPLRTFLFSLVLIQMMVPPHVYLIPQYLMVLELGWLNSIKALIFPGLVSAFGTFLLHQSFLAIPKELEEAAVLDGCNPFQIYWRIMLPLVKANLAALGIFTALFAWKDLLWPLIVNMSMDKMTLASGLASLRGQYLTDYPVLMAGSVIAMVPMIILFFMFQKQFIKGIAFTGSK
ncbi:carbohydrate ABC transporter permease [Paenibacillus chungangensis]|uniref:Carbohydrate ABC transporter permease n=1 Tax=Paenibacillus chungangensis TaxID=696535 RepID=A0ABW3HL89_9BACL